MEIGRFRLTIVALAVAILPTLGSGLPASASQLPRPHLANPRQIPSCTAGLLSHRDLTKRTVKSCLSMMGPAYVPERCTHGPAAYVIDTIGWAGISRAAEAHWVLRGKTSPDPLTPPAY